MSYVLCRLTTSNCKPLVDDPSRGSVAFDNTKVPGIGSASTLEVINRLEHTDIVVVGNIVSKATGSITDSARFTAWIPRTALIKRLPFDIDGIPSDSQLRMDVAAMPLSALSYGNVVPDTWANYNPVISQGVPDTIDARGLTAANPMSYQMSVAANATKFAYGFDVVLAEQRMHKVLITATAADGTVVHNQTVMPDNPHRRIALFLPTNEMVVLLRISMIQPS